MSNTNTTQSTVILDHLRSVRGMWVPMPELAEVSGAYAVHSRVAELRRAGHDIECRVDHESGARKFSYYRLHEAQPAKRQ